MERNDGGGCSDVASSFQLNARAGTTMWPACRRPGYGKPGHARKDFAALDYFFDDEQALKYATRWGVSGST